MLNRDKFLELGLSLVILLCLLGSGVYGYFYTKPAKQQASSLQSDPFQVVEDLQAKVDANPKDPSLQEDLGNACFDLGASLREQGNAEDANTYFQRAIKSYTQVQTISPKVEVQVDMATALYYTGQTDQAEAAYKQAITMDPNYLNARLNYGIFLFDVRKDPTEAKTQLEKALNLNPQGESLQKISDLLRSIAVMPGQATALDYTRDVEPVIFQNCTSCHGPGGVMAKSPLQTYQYVKKFVIPKNENSPIISALKDPTHPPQKEEIISIIEKWILAGAPGPK